MPLRQKPNKTWFFRFQYKGVDYSRGAFPNKALAKEAEDKTREKAVAESIYPQRKGVDLFFKEAVAWYITTYSEKKISGFVDKARLKLAAKFFENRKVSGITPEDIEAFLLALPKLRAQETPRVKGIKDHTKNHYLAIIRALFNRLRRRKKWLGDNPCLEVAFIQVPTARVRFLYPAEEKRLSPVVINEPGIWAYYFMGLHTGARIRELMGIRVMDVDLTMGQIFIPNSKNHKSRYIPLSSDTLAFVAPLVVGKKPEAGLLPKASYGYIRKHFMALCKIAEVEGFRIHDMRHTFAQRLLSQGESIYKVSHLLGHSSIKVTQDHYGHLAVKDLVDTVNRIDGVVSVNNGTTTP